MQTSLTLHTFFPAFGLPDPSPFCLKALLFMKMHHLDFQRKASDVRKAPKKKLPYLTHNGAKISDSELIIDYLEKELSLSYPIALTSEQAVQGHLLCRTLEERTYWALIHFRWFGEQSAPLIKEAFFSPVPKILRNVVFSIVQKNLRKATIAQGVGRHSEAMLKSFIRQDYHALSVMLGDKAYLFGDSPTRYDCTAMAFCGMLASEGLPTNTPDLLTEYPNLAAYWERAKSTYL